MRFHKILKLISIRSKNRGALRPPGLRQVDFFFGRDQASASALASAIAFSCAAGGQSS